MPNWATNANYSGLTGASAAYNGTPTKTAPADYANGFLRGAAMSAQEVNYLIDELKDQIAALDAANVPQSRIISAGNGLTGGGSLAADRSFAVLADGSSISVSASGAKVGTIDDTMHGSRGGGALHAAAVAGVSSGFLSASRKTSLDALIASLTVLDYSCLETSSTGTQNNWAPSSAAAWDACDLLVCNNASTLTITGLAAPIDNNSKWVKRIVSTNGTVILSQLSGSSSAANQIAVVSTLNSLVSDYAGFTLAYARGAASPRWYVVGSNAAS